jgi:hypothetical protein
VLNTGPVAAGVTRLGAVKAILIGADLSNADLSGVTHLNQSQLDQACGQPPKNLPIDLQWNAERPARKSRLHCRSTSAGRHNR